MMRSVRRKTLHRFIHELLGNDPSFRKELRATAPDGSRPVVVALRGDSVSSVLTEVEARGGAGNVIVPWLNGIVAISMSRLPDDAEEGGAHAITPRCTVGVFLERVFQDGGGTYEFVLEHSGHRDRGTAEAVAIAN